MDKVDKLYNNVCQKCSELITKKYSTSFSMGIRLFDKSVREPIYSIYGFVRFADEIVDTFTGVDKKLLLDEFRIDTFKAIENKVSLNPVLHAFQNVVNKYNLKEEHIHAFLDSMEMDLHKKTFTNEEYKKYIYGSAEVVGLMCLDVFEENPERVKELTPYASALGAAFQKINFLRDVKSDYEERGRTYFPNVDLESFDNAQKTLIENDIKKDFDLGLEGIKMLPDKVCSGVYLAYIYYISLFKKIKATDSSVIMQKRIRVKNKRKLYLLTKTLIRQRISVI